MAVDKTLIRSEAHTERRNPPAPTSWADSSLEGEYPWIVRFIYMLHRWVERWMVMFKSPSILIELERLVLAIPLFIHGAFCATFYPEPYHTFHRAVENLPPEHLVVLVCGLNANPIRLHEFSKLMKMRYESSKVPALIWNAEANWGAIRSQFTTGDGVLCGAARLAREVNGVLAANRTITRVSFIGHSLGGIYIRAALPLIFTRRSRQADGSLIMKTSTGAVPHIYMTCNTPHVGVRDYFPPWFRILAFAVHGVKYLPRSLRPLFRFLGKRVLRDTLGIDVSPPVPAEYAAFIGDQRGYGTTVKELMLLDGARPCAKFPAGRPPLLARLAADPFWLEPLGAFRQRVACAVVAHDSIVPCCSQALLPFVRATTDPRPAGREYEPEDPAGTVAPSTLHSAGWAHTLGGAPTAGGAKSASMWGAASAVVPASKVFEAAAERDRRLRMQPTPSRAAGSTGLETICSSSAKDENSPPAHAQGGTSTRGRGESATRFASVGSATSGGDPLEEMLPRASHLIAVIDDRSALDLQRWSPVIDPFGQDINPSLVVEVAAVGGAALRPAYAEDPKAPARASAISPSMVAAEARQHVRRVSAAVDRAVRSGSPVLHSLPSPRASGAFLGGLAGALDGAGPGLGGAPPAYVHPLLRAVPASKPTLAAEVAKVEGMGALRTAPGVLDPPLNPCPTDENARLFGGNTLWDDGLAGLHPDDLLRQVFGDPAQEESPPAPEAGARRGRPSVRAAAAWVDSWVQRTFAVHLKEFLSETRSTWRWLRYYIAILALFWLGFVRTMVVVWYRFINYSAKLFLLPVSYPVRKAVAAAARRRHSWAAEVAKESDACAAAARLAARRGLSSADSPEPESPAEGDQSPPVTAIDHGDFSECPDLDRVAEADDDEIVRGVLDETGDASMHVYGAFAADSIEFAAVESLRKNTGGWIHCLYEFGVRPWHLMSHNLLPSARAWVQVAMLGLVGHGRDEQLALVASWPVRDEDVDAFPAALRACVGGRSALGRPNLRDITAQHEAASNAK